MALCHTISIDYTDHQYFATSDLLISLAHNKTGKLRKQNNKLSTNLQTNIGMPSYILENVQGAINHLHLTLYISRT